MVARGVSGDQCRRMAFFAVYGADDPAAGPRRRVDHVLIVLGRIIRSFKGRVLLICFQLVTDGWR